MTTIPLPAEAGSTLVANSVGYVNLKKINFVKNFKVDGLIFDPKEKKL